MIRLKSLTPAALALLLTGLSCVQADERPASPGAVSERLEALERDASGFLSHIFGSGRVERRITTAQAAPTDLIVRLEQLESQIRQLTGLIEELQFRNHQLEQQLRRMQEDVDFRLQEEGRRGPPRPAQTLTLPPAGPRVVTAEPPQRRSDVFDPRENPTAPGAPRPLGSIRAAPSPLPPGPAADPDADPPADPPVGVPGGRAAGAPLDLSTLSDAAAADDPDGATGGAATGASEPLLPPPPPRNPSATGARYATLPPSASPKDAYDLAYGYLLRKDYALAEDSFREFLKRHPNDRMAPDAHYWLGESLFQRQRYRDAAEFFLTVSTKYEKSNRGPEAMLRLGQSLAALKEKEAACATFIEVSRKYPRAAPGVKQAVEREQKRVRC
jgi:tol-pal system protein YbgF